MTSWLLVTLLALLGQGPPNSATVEGVAVGVGTDQPIPNVRVELKPLNRKTFPNPVAITDPVGHFQLTGVEPGTYRVEFSAEGYARIQYGQRAPTSYGRDQGTPLPLGAGETTSGLIAHLTPTASVSGRILNADGRPSAKTSVALLRPAYSSEGEKTVLVVAQARTNDRGEYRLYWVTPGRYYLAAGYFGKEDDFKVGSEPGSPVRYFPNASQLDGAMPIPLEPAAELTSVDMIVDRGMLRSIRGRAVDLTTRLPAFYSPPLERGGGITTTYGNRVAIFALVAGRPVPLGVSDSYNYSDGSFEFEKVPPGTYLLQVGGLAGSPTQVTVANADVDGVLLTSLPTINVPVKVILEGREPALRMDQLWLSLDEVGEARMSARYSPTFERKEGGGVIRNVRPDTYRLRVMQPPAHFYVREMKYGKQDALSHPIEISRSEPSEITIVLAPNAGEIAGNVSGAGTEVVLIPNENRERREDFRTSTADESGHFVFSDVAPGEYRLYAWASIEPNSWFDPEVLAAYETRGVPVRVRESSKETVDLQIIP